MIHAPHERNLPHFAQAAGRHCWCIGCTARLHAHSSVLAMPKASRLADRDLSTCQHMLQGEVPKRAVTGVEFFHRFPLLHSYLLGQLRDAAQGVREATSQMHPSLYPILVLLSRLRHATQATGSAEVLLPPIAMHTESWQLPVFSVSEGDSHHDLHWQQPPCSSALGREGCPNREGFLISLLHVCSIDLGITMLNAAGFSA